ncbi:hypothetical protein [Rhizobacter fulvus]
MATQTLGHTPKPIRIDTTWMNKDAARVSAAQAARLAHYNQRKARPSNRNIGPGPTFTRLRFHAYFLCTDIELEPGTLVNGTPVPAGSRLVNYPLARPITSRRHAKKSLAKIRHRVPGAYVVESRRAVPNAKANCPVRLLLSCEQSQGVRHA